MLLKMVVQSIAIPVLVLRIESQVIFVKVCGDMLNLEEPISQIGLSSLAQMTPKTLDEQLEFANTSGIGMFA